MKGGAQMHFSVEQEKEAYLRRYNHAIGMDRLATQMAFLRGGESPHGDEPPPGGKSPLLGLVPRVGALFWHSAKSRCKSPAWNYETGVRTAVGRSGLDLMLLSYDGVTLPGTTAVDASPYIARDVFDALLAKGIRIQLLADYIRMAFLAASGGGWFLDGDSVWIKAAPDVSTGAPFFGHLFHTIKAGKGQPRGTLVSRLLYWELHYAYEPQDQCWVVSPFVFGPQSPVLTKILCLLKSIVFAPANEVSRQYYNIGMDIVRREVAAWGLEGAIVEPVFASPLSPRQQTTYYMRATDAVLDRSLFKKTYCINNYWGSSKDLPGKDVHNAGGSSRIHARSLWMQLLRWAAHPSTARQCGSTPGAKRRRLGMKQDKSLEAGGQVPDASAMCEAADKGGAVPGASSSDAGGGVPDEPDALVWPQAPPFVDVAAFRARWLLLGLLGKGQNGQAPPPIELLNLLYNVFL